MLSSGMLFLTGRMKSIQDRGASESAFLQRLRLLLLCNWDLEFSTSTLVHMHRSLFHLKYKQVKKSAFLENS